MVAIKIARMKNGTEEDIHAINEILNDHYIRPHIYKGAEPLDCSVSIKDFLYFFDHTGVIVMEPLPLGGYLCMAGFREGFGGMNAVNRLREVGDELFLAHNCPRLVVSIKPYNTRSIRIGVALGLSDAGEATKRVVMEIDETRWMLRSKRCYEEGKRLDVLYGLNLDWQAVCLLGGTSLKSDFCGPTEAVKSFNDYAMSTASKRLEVSDACYNLYLLGEVVLALGSTK